MYICTICNIDFMYPHISIPEFDRPVKDLINKRSKYCNLCDISTDNWQRHLNSIEHNIKKHILTCHKPQVGQNDIGQTACKLCNIKVQNLYKHRFSTLHRFNVDLISVLFFHNVKDFVDHFSMMKKENEVNDILNFNEENPFWITAKEILDDEQYNQLKEELIGRQRVSRTGDKRRNTRNRNTGYRRSIRAS